MKMSEEGGEKHLDMVRYIVPRAYSVAANAVGELWSYGSPAVDRQHCSPSLKMSKVISGNFIQRPRSLLSTACILY